MRFARLNTLYCDFVNLPVKLSFGIDLGKPLSQERTQRGLFKCNRCNRGRCYLLDLQVEWALYQGYADLYASCYVINILKELRDVLMLRARSNFSVDLRL